MILKRYFGTEKEESSGRFSEKVIIKLTHGHSSSRTRKDEIKWQIQSKWFKQRPPASVGVNNKN